VRAVEVIAFFEWLDASSLASISKAYGGVFAVVQMSHLLALALLGGAVLLSDLRLLGVLMRDVPSEVVVRDTQRWFNLALVVIVLSGIFMSSAVAMKLYYNEMFWAKMAGLAFGAAFVYGIRDPLLKHSHDTINPWSLRAVAVTSLLVWFTVAAAGRWIGFS
tara:strand:+ start:3382 stop:3867 length:486 start_codon:yes stop_codon:yes gene_type:complete